MARQPRCPYCFKILNSPDKVGAVISVKGSIGPDEGFSPLVESKRWNTNNTKEVKICKECVIYAEIGIMPVSKKKLGELYTKLLKRWENQYAYQSRE